MSLFTLSLAPVAVLLCGLVLVDRNREPFRVVLITLLLGALTPIPVLAAGFVVSKAFGIPFEPTTLGEAVAVSFVLAALVEEVFKFLVLWRYSAQHDAFDEPFDGIVYGTAASLGFAASENLLYVFGGSSTVESVFIAILRACTAVPLHAMCGVIMGICIGVARFSPRFRWWWMVTGLFGAIVLHGIYDSFVFGAGVLAGQGREDLASLSGAGMLATLLLAGVVSLLAIARMRRDQVVAVVAALPAGVLPPPEVSRFLAPLPPPPPRIGAAIPPPPPSVVAVTAPPWLPMLAMILEAIAAATGVILLGIGVVYTETETIPDAASLVACSLFGITGLLSLAGIAVAAAALVRRDRWPGASIGAIVTGSLIVMVFAAILLIGTFAS